MSNINSVDDDFIPLPFGRKRRSPRWKKLIVDGLLVAVYPISQETAKERRMAHLSGVEVQEATRKERQEFLASHLSGNY